jgi:hypothetical protein
MKIVEMINEMCAASRLYIFINFFIVLVCLESEAHASNSFLNLYSSYYSTAFRGLKNCSYTALCFLIAVIL